MPDTPITMDTVYFYKFNNYYNRIIKRYDTIEEYGTPLATQENCNFVHGDGVNATFTMNKLLSLKDTPDYVIVKDKDDEITRYFVTNSFKTRSGQDALTLRRDIIADFYSDVIKHSPCLIRKGYVPQTNPLIFNDEGVRYNKIKEREVMIKDESNCSYIVGFISNTAPAKATINGTIKDDNYVYAYTDINEFPYKAFVEGAGNNHTNSARQLKGNENLNLWFAVKFSTFSTTGRNALFEMTYNYYGASKPSWYNNSYSSNYVIDSNLCYTYPQTNPLGVSISHDYETNHPSQGERLGNQEVGARYRDCCFNSAQMNQSTGAKITALSLLGVEDSEYSNISIFDNKKIKIGNVIYEAHLKSENETNRNVSANSTLVSFLNSSKPFNSMVQNMAPASWNCNYSSQNFTTDNIKVLGTTQDWYLELTQADVEIHTAVDSPSSRTHLTDQPYDMFVLVNESNISYKIGTTDYVSNHDVNMNMAQAIIQEYGDASYDLQIVPFNPIRGSILADGSINWLNYDSHPIYDANNQIVGHYVMCSSADLKFTLEKDELKFLPTDYKKDFNLKQYRLCSPNQETIFEFSPAMNDGITTWEITANYRPYASYIKIQPSWNWLYGLTSYEGLTDFRGLVYNSILCVTQLSDAWANYVNSNKNYQQIFDTQIGTLTKSQNIQLNAMEETLGWRSYTGMPISSIARVIGGSKDIEMQRELNNVALEKMNADFNYQMDNIKSIPHTIRKLTNINGDTRIFPYIEVYSCSSVEEESFNLKMKYTGYTIMTTGYIWDYLKLNEEIFIQADLIRLDMSRSEESADNHIAIEIASELEKGVYITKESE